MQTIINWPSTMSDVAIKESNIGTRSIQTYTPSMNGKDKFHGQHIIIIMEAVYVNFIKICV